MRRTRIIAPKLEQLEGRWVPATIRLVAGNLFISDQVSALTVTVTTTPGKVTVIDGTKTVNVSGVGKLISITGTNLTDSIKFNGNTGFKGSLIIRSGNGNDTITLSGPLAGNATILTGAGNDGISTSNAVKIGGNLTFQSALGSDTFTQSGQAYKVGGNFTVAGFSSYAMGGGNSTLQVGGNLSILAAPNKTAPLTVTFNGISVTVGKSLSIVGGQGLDTVNVSSQVSVGKNVSAQLQDGTNILSYTPLAGGTGIGGNFTLSGGSGNDTILLGANSVIAGDLALNLGEGTNTITTGLGGNYFGDFTVTGGNGTNTLTLLSPVNIAGDLVLTFGNGTNTTFVTSSNIGGTVRYQGGNGSDTLFLTPLAAALYNVDFLFGTGSSALTLNGNVTLTGLIVGTGGTNTFTQAGATLLSTLQLINYP